MKYTRDYKVESSFTHELLGEYTALQDMTTMSKRQRRLVRLSSTQNKRFNRKQ